MQGYRDMMTPKNDTTAGMRAQDGVVIERVAEQDFAGMRERWNRLLDRSPTNEIFLSWEWMHSWWNAFKNDNKQLLILIGTDIRGDLIGIAPFYVEHRNSSVLRGRKIIGFCSSFEVAPDHLDVLCERGFEHIFSHAVFTYMREHATEWDLIHFDGVKDDSVIKNYFKENEQGLDDVLINCDPQSGCPYLMIDRSFQDYLGTFSRKTRYTLARKKRILLEKEQYEYHVLKSAEDNSRQYIRELFSLHAGRALRKNVLTVFSGEEVYGIHEDFINRLLAENKIVIAFLTKGNEFLAGYYCIKHNNKYYYYQTGISEQGEAKSAGTVLMSLIIEQAFQEGCSEFDFLRGDEKYKYFWASNTRYNYSILIRKKTLFNRIVHHLTRSVIKPGKRMLKYVYR
jgi:CelD/BcsL family acetyltransferase involved in cellulose biosynthesis